MLSKTDVRKKVETRDFYISVENGMSVCNVLGPRHVMFCFGCQHVYKNGFSCFKVLILKLSRLCSKRDVFK